MLIAVVDTETTGDDDQAQVMDLAVVTVSATAPYLEVGRWSTLVRPSVPCALEARATHHITDAMVADAWTFGQMLDRRGLEEFYHPKHEVVLAAHNVEFDRRMLVQSLAAAGCGDSVLPTRSICTWRCAQHVWPDSPRHSNQVLRYYLDLDSQSNLNLASLPPHRALPDAVVTSRILMRLLRERTAEELIELTQQPVLLQTIKFGKHAGMPWSQVPRSYLQWILGEGPLRVDSRGNKAGFDEDTRHTCRYHLGML